MASLADAAMAAELAATRPHLFASEPVFISAADRDAIADLIAAVEGVSALPEYHRIVLAHAPAIARHDFGPRGGILGFDFHVTAHGPQLIEVNTNPGGALLNIALATNNSASPDQRGGAHNVAPSPEEFEHAVLATFAQEWRRQRGTVPLRHVAIVDNDPLRQYLYPEFLLFERLFRSSGIRAAVAPASALEWRDGSLWHAGEKVDLVYNRLTDFYLEDPLLAPLRAAYEAGAVVLTPGPRAHAIYANKRNLITLGDRCLLETIGVDGATSALLEMGIPHTQLVTPNNAAPLWRLRDRLFFKPAAGYGSKAAYRGDKLTRRVWAEILAGDYVAQDFVAPGLRTVRHRGTTTTLKFDLRAYAIDGRVLLLAARLYQGQTTNFRTPGGGFAPVVVVPHDAVTRTVASAVNQTPVASAISARQRR
jgi:hypothetical protein